MAKKGGKQKRSARSRVAGSAFDAIALEGGLIQPDMVAAAAAVQASDQAEADYGLDPKEKLRDVVQTKFTLAQSLHARFLGSDKGAAATRRFASGLIAQVFEFTGFTETEPVTTGDRGFPIGHQALGGRVPIVLAPYGMLDQALTIFGDGTRKRSAAQLLQEYLNASDTALWGITCDGVRLRLCRDSASLTRPAFIEGDLARMFDADAPLIADFAALWLMLHASRFGKPGTPVSDCPLERWREEGRKQGSVAREKLRDGVQEALLALGRGFLDHPANEALRAELSNGKLAPQEYLEALLRLIYRFIFVFTAEDRDVLHLPPPEAAEAYEPWHKAKSLYARGYAFARLRERAAKRSVRDRHSDGWEGVQIVFRSLARGETRLALPALGALFGANGARELGNCALTNARLCEALFHLTWLSTAAGRERVNWRDMQTEELGSVYESLLELSPRLGGPTGFDFIDVAGNERKTTASYYTPDSLVQALLDEALDPLIAETVKGKTGGDAAEALLSLRIIDPACGSGHFLLAAGRRIAARVAELKSPGAPGAADFRHWLRECARRCLFGVDRNPMAVDLAKVALWIETVEPGKPLTFFDAHIRCGDALLGIYDFAALAKGIPDDAYKPLTGDGKSAAREWAKRNRAEREARAKGQLPISEPPRIFADAVLAMESGAEDALEQVEAKTRTFHNLLAGPEHFALQVACDVYVAAFLLPKTAPPGRHVGESPAFIPTTQDLWSVLSGRQIDGRIEGKAVDAARKSRAFHWPLEFPQVFLPVAGGRKGFDLAIGNPPWDRIKLQEKEFFGSRAPDIADAPNKAARQRMIDALEAAPAGSSERKLFDSFVQAKRVSEAASALVRMPDESGGRFALSGHGDVNTFSLFTELFSTISRFAGLVVPSELATSDTTKELFAAFVDSGRLKSMYDFQTGQGYFDRIGHARFKFLLVAIGEPVDIPNPAIRVAYFLRNDADLADKSRYFELSKSDFELFNPNTRTAPVFRTKADAELTRHIYGRLPVLIDDSKGAQGNPWGIDFARMFDMSGDSGLFRTARQLETTGAIRAGRGWEAPETAAMRDVVPGRYVPLYEAKMIHHYDSRWATYEVPRGANMEKLEPRDVTEVEKANPDFDPQPRYFVPESEVSARLNEKGWSRGWLMGWRDITNATNERTVISSSIPRAGVGDKFLLLLPAREPELVAALLATLSSLPCDYVARQKLGGTSFKYFVMKQLVAPTPAQLSTALRFIIPRVIELTYTSGLMRPFAQDLGYSGPPFAWNADRRALLRAELDAQIAQLYGLDRNQLSYILDPEDVKGKGFPSLTFPGLRKNEIAKYGEYRTARLVLDAWDRLERGELAI